MSVQQRRKYDSDFKRNAVKLTEESGRTISGVAENLGVNKDVLYRCGGRCMLKMRLLFQVTGEKG